MQNLQVRFIVLMAPLALLVVLAFSVLFELHEGSRAREELTAKLNRIAKTQSIILAKLVWQKDKVRQVLIVASIVADPDVRSVRVFDVDGEIINSAGPEVDRVDPALVKEISLSFATQTGFERTGKLRIVMTDGRIAQARFERRAFVAGLAALLFVAVVVSAVIAYRWTVGIPMRLLLDFRSIVENLPTAIFLMDLNGRFRLVNKQFAQWYGRPANLVEGASKRTVFGEEVAREYERLEQEVRAKNQASTIDLQQVFADGSERHVSIISFPVQDEAGRTVAIGTINSDVTERHRAEAALQQSQEQLRQAQKMDAVGQLTGGVAHDFNNLLAVIMGNTELLKEELGREDPTLAPILRAAKRGAELTQRLLAFSRQQSLRPRVIDLGELVSGMSVLLSRTLGTAVEIEIVKSPDLWAASADPGQVENALLNLAINSRDAMPAGGKLTIECANAQLDAAYVGNHPEARVGAYAVLAVSDQGIGMTAEVQAHALEPFFTTKEVGQGSGLGLSMIYGFAKQSGGHVSIYSEDGRGTTVKLYLPRAEEAARQAGAKPEDGVPRGAGEVVLVVEDDPEVRVLAARLLANLDYRVIDVADAAAAHEALADGTPVDLVLSDVVLPGGTSGPAFAEEARSIHPNLKIIFMSGYPAEAAKRNGFLGSNQVLLNKPFQMRQLAKAVRDALG